jgi:hypothetical protein
MQKTKSYNEIDEYISDNCPKREAWGYCVEQPITNKNKVKSQVDVTPQKGTRKWETVYKAVTTWDQREVARDKSQTVCIKKARAFVEANPDVSLKVIEECAKFHSLFWNKDLTKSFINLNDYNLDQIKDLFDELKNENFLLKFSKEPLLLTEPNLDQEIAFVKRIVNNFL